MGPPSRLVDFVQWSWLYAMSEIVPVELLNEHQDGRIVEIVGPTDWQHRLEEMGLREGQLVRLIQRGEPFILAIQNHRLSLRCEPGTMILVEIESARASCSGLGLHGARFN